MDINNQSTINNNNTNGYSITNLLTNAFNRGVSIFSSVPSYIPLFSRERETDNNILPEDNIDIEYRESELEDLDMQLKLLLDQIYDLRINLLYASDETRQQNYLECMEILNKKIAEVRELIKREKNPYYDMLEELPADIKYDTQEAICPISLEPLMKGDTVYCEKQLYSFESLKKVATMDKPLVPHSRTPMIWNKNVFKLPNYGIANYNKN